MPAGTPTAPFFDRPFLGVRQEVATLLLESIRNPVVRQLPPGVGAVEQWVDSVDVLTRPAVRRAATQALVRAGAAADE